MLYKTTSKEPIKFDWCYDRDTYIKKHDRVKGKTWIDVLKGIVKRIKGRG